MRRFYLEMRDGAGQPARLLEADETTVEGVRREASALAAEGHVGGSVDVLDRLSREGEFDAPGEWPLWRFVRTGEGVEEREA